MSFIAYWGALFSIAQHNRSASKVRLPIVDRKGHVGTHASRSWQSWSRLVNGDGSCFDEHAVPTVHSISFDHDKSVIFDDGSRQARFPVPTVSIEFSWKGTSIAYTFGSRAVRESMAAMLDQKLARAAGGAIRHRALPYRALELAAENIARNAGSEVPSPELLVRFADRSLMTIAPGFFVLKYIEAHCQPPLKDVDFIVQQVDRQFAFTPADFMQLARFDLKTFADALSVTEHRAEMLKWFRTHVEVSLDLRKKDPDFFIAAMLSADPWRDALDLLTRVSIPVVIGKQGAPGFYSIGPPELDAEGKTRDPLTDTALFFRLLRFAVNLHAARDQSTECPIYQGCNFDFRGDLCRNQPWTHSARNPSCAMGAAFATIGVKSQRVDCRHRPS